MLELISKAMDSRYSISAQRNKNGEWYSLVIYNQKICRTVCRLGVCERKSENLELVPPDVPEEFKKHFFRGFFDGDGSVFFRSGGKHLRAGIYSASATFIDELSSWAPVDLNRYDHKGIIGATAIGNDKALKLAAWMYEGSTMFMGRKRDRFEEVHCGLNQ